MLRRNAFRWGLFLFFFLTELALGFYISYIVGYMHSDALSRVANAFYVLYSRDPHLGAIGFVWNPLPSLMELAVLVLYPILPELASYGLAGVLVTSVFAGLTALLLYDAGRRNGLSFGMSLGLSLLYCLNPFVFLFGANGLSDAPYIYFLMYTVIRFGDWLKTRQISHLVLAGFALALAFWTRYEAVPFGVSLGAALLIVLLLMPPGEGEKPLPWAERARKVEATSFILLLPAVFSGLLWIFFNYIIMGDALYFLHSEYSNQAQSDALKGDENFNRIFNSPLLALVFVAKKTAWFSVPLAAILLIRTFAGRLLRWETLVLVCLFLSIPGLQFALLMKESSFGWFRYFMYVYPITVAWIPYELGLLRKRRAAFTVVAAGLLTTSALLSYAVTNPQIAPDENTFLTIKSGNKYYQSQILDRSVAKWLDENMGDATILTDSASAFTILVNSRNTKKFLITSDYDFKKAKNDPPGNGVDYILIPRPLPNADKSAINTKYKDLYEKGNEWAELYHNFDNEWRLYKIKKWQPPAS
ncbi:hypothetical protein AV654_09570 [Paenibacillus elgii]|uniref:Glycosyltransferase RgtA/B/C/D-like domain-containing protein n=1 Tax=Paenibacillus elgii TaxID=189691 RepID=A0A163ZJZ3_9BACL|nr:glycosyltransferase family 39 protein [Paenibacillus elgii]KZE81913.1 hypothetical protein AV654_09570 [Paenibacillus elgii]